jgi:sugar transferase (PEP-CTERM/EpsH1 system associated)
MKLLFITARFPYPPVKGDKVIPYQRMKYFSQKHEITLLSLADTKIDQQHISIIRQYCKHIHLVPLRKIESFANILVKGLSDIPLQVLYFKSLGFKRKLENLLSENKYDLVHIFTLRMAPYVSAYKGCPKIIELIDSMELNMKRRASLEKNIKKWVFNLESRRLAVYEKMIIKNFDNAVVVSQIDKDMIKQDSIVVSPNGVDTETFHPISDDQKNPDLIIFTGNMGYFPNQQAVLCFANEIFPLIQQKRAGAKFWIVGCSPPKKIKMLERTNGAIKVLGFVGSITDYINKATVSVCPANSGSGIQNKILEALACGVPVVVTSLAKGDIRLDENDGIFVSDTADSFADKVIEIMTNTHLQNVIKKRAPLAVQKNYSWEKSNITVENIYSKLLNQTT